MRILLALLVAGLPGLAREIPKGTVFEIRLSTAVSSSSSSGQACSAVLIAPVMAGSEVLLNAGATLTGTIRDVVASTDTSRAEMTVEFTSIRDAKGHEAKIETKLTAVDNARESVNADGRIVGIDPSSTLSTRLDQGIGKLAQQYGGFADLLGTAKNAMVKKTDASIKYDPGVEMSLTLTAPLEWTAAAEQPALRAIEPAAELLALVNAEPFRTLTDKTNKPSDLTNVMFIGTADQIRAAFEAAGWSTADALSSTSKFQTFQAMAEMRGYKEAPMSVLLLDDRTPDLSWQKTNNTFSARHHLRIWQRPQTFHGQPVWVCSSTHDTGIGFSDKERTFIHKIDSSIDHERAKVVSDLVFTGKVAALALVQRAAVPTSTYNGTGDAVQTDGAMAVIEF